MGYSQRPPIALGSGLEARRDGRTAGEVSDRPRAREDRILTGRRLWRGAVQGPTVEYDEARSAYEALREEISERGVDFTQHEKLLQRRAQQRAL